MFLELFRFAKKMKFYFFDYEIHCISSSSLGACILCAGTHWSNGRSMITAILYDLTTVYVFQNSHEQSLLIVLDGGVHVYLPVNVWSRTVSMP